MSENPTLAINLSSSVCKNCGSGANPRAKSHGRIYEYSELSGRIPGCGIRWTHVTSDYFNVDGLYDTIKKMRPDLIFVDPMEHFYEN